MFCCTPAKAKNKHGDVTEDTLSEDTMTRSRLLAQAKPSRRSVLKSAALGSVAAITAP
jgi:hypothetical protein